MKLIPFHGERGPRRVYPVIGSDGWTDHLYHTALTLHLHRPMALHRLLTAAEALVDSPDPAAVAAVVKEMPAILAHLRDDTGT